MTAVDVRPARVVLPRRAAAVVIWWSWPAGLLLVVAGTVGGLPLAPFVLAAAAYLGGLVLALRSIPITGDRVGVGRRDATLLLLSGPLVFVLAGLTGPPTAAAPGRMLLNAAVLVLVAAVLVVAAVGLALDSPPGRARRSAALAVAALLLGSAGWLLNLVGRWAVVLSGASEQQAAVEAQAWMASVYLRGLEGPPSFVGYLLVFFDLTQLVYVGLSYGCFVLLARVGAVTGWLGEGAARTITGVGLALGGVLVVGATTAAWIGSAGAPAAGAAFVVSIPFMTTLLPWLIGAATLTRHGR